jgi:hypothetical protein
MAESSPESTIPAAQRLRGRQALRLHLTVITGLVLCVAAFWFELKRALGGNALSWAYVFEWPLLAVFAVYMWWQFLHPGLEKRKGKKATQLDPAFSSMLERWQESQDDLERSRSHKSDAPDE